MEEKIMGGGTNAFVRDGVLYRGVPDVSVQIESASDLDELSELPPTAVAYTAGFEHVWQKSSDDTWEQIV